MSQNQESGEKEEKYVQTVSVGEQIASVFFMFIGVSGVVGGLVNLFDSNVDSRIALIMTIVSLGFGIFGVILWKDNR